MKIDRFEIIDRCLFWREKKILIIGDLHLGYEECLNELGMSIPKRQLEESLDILEKVMKKTGRLSGVVLLGDIKHYFAGILKDEFLDFLKIVRVIEGNLEKDGKIIITKGNHDNILEPIIKRNNLENIELVDCFEFNDILFLHGNKSNFERNQIKIFDKKIKLIVVGHFHPAISLVDDVKKEIYKCFLYGKIRKFKKNTIIVPSFFPLVEGTDILTDNFIGQYFSVPNLSVYVLDGSGKVYDFGKVKNIKNRV